MPGSCFPTVPFEAFDSTRGRCHAADQSPGDRAGPTLRIAFHPMKSFLTNLLVCLSVALCGFNAYQWYREAKLQGRIEMLGSEIYKKSGDIQNLQQTVQVNQDEIKRLETLREAALSTIKSNKVFLAQVEAERDTFRKDLVIQTAKAAQVEQYKEAFTKANENLRKQNEVIVTQNEKMKQLADERNEIVLRLNKLATEYKSLGEDYTKLMGMYTNLVAQVQAENEKNTRGSKK